MNKNSMMLAILAVGVVTALTTKAVQAADVEVTSQQLDKHIYVLFGRGGNIAAHVGADGTYIIDDQFAKLAPQIKAKLKELNPNAAEFVLNTHYHGDHTGGNEVFAQAGAHVIAHHNVHKRLEEKHGAGSEFLPRLSFGADLTLHFNGEHARLVHYAHAHTDGDAVVFFSDANVVHMGDIYFNTGGLPFVDVDGGGSVDGILAALESIGEQIDDNTQVIPGHGPVSDKAGLMRYQALVAKAKTLMLDAMEKEQTLDAVIAADPFAELNLKYADWLPKERVITLFYRSLGGEVLKP
ncbi:MBL fold metallo-hydrolase [Pseudoalteromonas sp. BDTF-M6]|uniref:MBL fold metallo-hydrolase n=1 Tax=Pseudoalteromonas sp. BDTF-M6 TaxID=2796132 RepID=UPI001BAFC6C5|nr:MBL fold metallo-hydrolase [Pseudoalteromonas sp. BDTF-M6]MBS3797082.1 MBL fold metallo-hydrolase [Pseudoalteromonas sp. BDTF-M6]